VKANGGWVRKRHSLKNVLERELGVTLGDKKRFQRGKAWTADITDEHLEYAAGDVIHLKPLADKLLALVKEHGLTEVWELERRAKPLFLAMCTRGIPLDLDLWGRLTNELEQKIVSLKENADNLGPPHPEGFSGTGTAHRRPKKRSHSPDLRSRTCNARLSRGTDTPWSRPSPSIATSEASSPGSPPGQRDGIGATGSTRSGTPQVRRRGGRRALLRTCRACLR
jgi:hypothetical protein